MVAGGMCGCQGVCMVAGGCVVAGGHAWLLGRHAWLGACAAVGGMCGCGGHAWLWGEECIGYDKIRSMSGQYISYWNAFLLKLVM